MTLRTTARTALAALAIGTLTFGSAAVTPAAASGKHHGFHHGWLGQHWGFAVEAAAYVAIAAAGMAVALFVL